MATNTYVALDKVTVGTATPSITFTSIPQGYTDLVLIINAGTSDASEQDCLIRVNGDTGSNYSATYLYGTGSSAASGRNANQTESTAGYPIRPTLISTLIVQFPNYSNTTTYKNWLGRANSADSMVYTHISLWRNTNAINTILLYPSNSKNFLAGSTFSLYGIAATNTAKATGGTISYGADGYTYHTFLSTGTFTPLQSLTADCLVVAGGGGGGSDSAGGGGAGGYRSSTGISLTSTPYSVTVGSGGTGSTNASVSAGGSGTDSVFSTITSAGGGGGGSRNATYRNGISGGSGGGACNTSGGTAGSGNTPSTSPSQGSNGGSSSNNGGAGGGGATAVGGGGSGFDEGGAGGAGSNSLATWATNTGTGVSGYYAGGGGGGSYSTTRDGGAGGAGGGGAGGNGSSQSAPYSGTAGTVNTGGGGGGSARGNTIGANGGSGIVIIRYATL